MLIYVDGERVDYAVETKRCSTIGRFLGTIQLPFNSGADRIRVDDKKSNASVSCQGVKVIEIFRNARATRNRIGSVKRTTVLAEAR